jgi:dimethylargininase
MTQQPQPAQPLLIDRLAECRDGWLQEPNEETGWSMTPAELIESERRRMPVTMDRSHLDCDCPICQAISLCATREEWDQQQEEDRQFSEEMARKERERSAGAGRRTHSCKSGIRIGAPMLHAMTREVSPTLAACELTHLPRQRIDVTRAALQHQIYLALLAELGATIVPLPPLPDCPDAVFVEDTCVVLDEIAIVAPMGCDARRRETEGLAAILAQYRPVVELRPSGRLDGGDVLRVGTTLYVGLSGRTNAEGCELLRCAAAPHGYRIVPVAIQGCLHLRSGCTSLGGDVLLANRTWIDTRAMAGMEVIDTSGDEPFAANALRIGDTLVYPTGFPRTQETLQRQGFQLRTIDISELQKAEAGLTCLSVVFDQRADADVSEKKFRPARPREELFHRIALPGDVRA